MNLVIARLLAAVVAAAGVYVLGLIGVPVSDTDRESLAGWLTEGLTGAGGMLLLGVYASAHKYLNRWFNPSDVASR